MNDDHWTESVAMMIPTLRHIGLGLAMAVALAGPGAARAQSVSEISLGGGMMDYDLSGVGQTLTLTVRAVAPLSRTFLLEPGIVWARPDLQGGGGATLLIPEVQVQAQLPLGAVLAPYLGAGVGAGLAFAEGDNEYDVALSAGAGVRIDVGGLLGVVIDGRVHGYGTDFAGSSAELTIGLRLRR
jgi:hypothetical protein